MKWRVHPKHRTNYGIKNQLPAAIGLVSGKSSIMVATTIVVDVKAVMVALAAPKMINRPTSALRNTAADAVKLTPLPVVAAGVSVILPPERSVSASKDGGGLASKVASVQLVSETRLSFLC